MLSTYSRRMGLKSSSISCSIDCPYMIRYPPKARTVFAIASGFLPAQTVSMLFPIRFSNLLLIRFANRKISARLAGRNSFWSIFALSFIPAINEFDSEDTIMSRFACRTVQIARQRWPATGRTKCAILFCYLFWPGAKIVFIWPRYKISMLGRTLCSSSRLWHLFALFKGCVRFVP